ncbi:hypothetical protein PL75_03230 [Neisseria arctica]|uniref:Uncharacterized protein n=1 Tax=Neisseria arctica TaxID=1470200 RepID=A0A0J0YT15_9NEIS|nr:hypothetical protein [Neisseria arctica]KLT73252.1 hypothetical protein PL75_03230 [Neisseria arctica]UOO87494.1 hypothetical protein LVJ86_04415 [Neisseria arctica]
MALKLKKKQEIEARWVDYKDGDETLARFLIKPIEDSRYQVAVERNQIGTRADGVTIDNIADDARPFLEKDAEAVARYLLVDWDGVEDADGNAIKYSPETAYEVLTKTQIGLVLWAWIKEQAEAIQAEAYKDRDELVKKPLNGTNGKPVVSKA